MKFNELVTYLNTGPTIAERRRILSSPVGDSADGIIDGETGTDCNKDYWEREYGVVDAIVALYDILNGLDTSAEGYLDILGSMRIDVGSVVLDGTLEVDGLITGNNGLVLSAGDIDIDGEFNSDGSTSNFGGVVVHDMINRGIYYKEGYQSAYIDEIYKMIYMANGHICISTGYSDVETQSFASGGSLKFISGSNVALDINPRGSLYLGGGTNTIPNAPGIFVQKADANGSNGSSKIEFSTLAADNKSSSTCSIKETNKSSTLADKTIEIQLVASRGNSNSNRINFLFDNVVKAYMTGAGIFNIDSLMCSDLSVDGDIGCNIIQATDIGCNNIAAGQNISADTMQLLGEFSNKFLLSVSGSIGIGTECVQLVASTDYKIKMEDASGNSSTIGLLNANIGNGISVIDSSGYLEFQRGTVHGTPIGEFIISIMSDVNDAVGGICWSNLETQEIYGIFVDQNGMLRTAEYGGSPSGFGAAGQGHVAIPKSTNAINTTNQSTLNSEVLTVSDKCDASVAIVNDIADGNIVVVSDGTNWSRINGGNSRGYAATADANYTLANGVKVLGYTPYSGSTGRVTLPTARMTVGAEITIFDVVGDANTKNVTIATEGAEKINGSDTYVINTSYGSVTLVSNGSHWFIK